MIRRLRGRHSESLFTVLRIVAGTLFWFHGAQKFGMFGGLGAGGEVAPPLTLLWFAGVIEFVGGAAIACGLFTRWIAFIAAGEMAVAYFLSHAPRGPWPLTNGGELAILYCVLWLVVAARGPGRISLDAALGLERRQSSS
jgi:putative oxidoreductase